jgi:hypothetical protein
MNHESTKNTKKTTLNAETLRAPRYTSTANAARLKADTTYSFASHDQRHTVNLFGTYRMSDRLSLSARFRYGSNFPTVGDYDARANRTFTWERKRLTLFLEAINVANRRNSRSVVPSVDLQTFAATGLYETMVPLIPAVGVLLEF